MSSRKSTYTAREFARLAGVTVRALHHYDRLGLLRPARTAAGYRVYTAQDLHALQQIVILKFIGVPLREVAEIQRAGPARLIADLSAQRMTLELKRHLLDRAIEIIRELEARARAGQRMDPETLKRLMEVIDMQNDSDAWKEQYQELVETKKARLKALSPQTLADLRAMWDALVSEIRGALHEDPRSPKAQALARRSTELLAELMGRPIGSTDLARQRRLQAWSPAMASFVDEPVWDFLKRALAGAG